MKPYYQEDGVTIYHGDCLAVLPHLRPVDHVITDPPYESDSHNKARRVQRGAERGTAKARAEMRVEVLPFPAIRHEDRQAVALAIGALCRRWTLVFCQAEAGHLWEASLIAAGLNRRRWCVWVKPDGQPQFTGDRPGMGYETIMVCHAKGRSRWNGGGRLGVFVHIKNVTGSRLPDPHPTAKPEALMNELVTLFTDQGDVILDPFAGSGTTLVAAKRFGRQAIGIETNEDYCKMAVSRLRQRALEFVS